MRKLMNKKGFSLVELMIVVVIMGILIAVAIPLYGAITKNANNKTCASNIQTIKTTVANYYTSTDPQVVPGKAQLESMMENGKMPVCPITKAEDSYTVKVTTKGSALVQCTNYQADGDHKPDGHCTDSAAWTAATALGA